MRKPLFIANHGDAWTWCRLYDDKVHCFRRGWLRVVVKGDEMHFVEDSHSCLDSDFSHSQAKACECGAVVLTREVTQWQ